MHLDDPPPAVTADGWRSEAAPPNPTSPGRPSSPTGFTERSRPERSAPRRTASSARTDHPTILACDHRGEGLDSVARTLTDQGYAVTLTSTLHETARALERTRDAAVLLLDPLVRGGAVELDAVSRFRDGRAPLPLLLVLDDCEPESGVRSARRLGDRIWDLVHRNATAEEYVLRVERLLQRVAETEELGLWRHRAVHDDRTELLRPSAFDQRLEEHFAAAQRHGFDMALLILDLDGFGQINKQHDHTVGDQLISRVGEAIRKSLRTEDAAGRLGGDEFGILLPYTGKLEAVHVVNRIAERIRRGAGLDLPARRLRVTTSIGFETFDGTDLVDVGELRLHAERALRSAKREGGDRAVYFRALERGGESLTSA